MAQKRTKALTSGAWFRGLSPQQRALLDQTMEQALVQRFALSSQAGFTFGGKRDTFGVLGYQKTLTVADFRERYKRNGLAAAIIEAKPNATFRGGASVVEDEMNDDNTPFEQACEDMFLRLNAWSKFEQLDVVTGIGRYGVLMIGAPGKPETPLPKNLRPEQIAFLTPYSEEAAKMLPEDIDVDISSPRFGQPSFYQLYTYGVNGQAGKVNKVHWSRCIHVVDGPLDLPMYGQPRLERVWNWLDDIDKLTGAGSEAFWQRAHQGYHFNVDSETPMDEEERKVMKESFDEFMHGLRRYVSTRKVDLKALGSDTADFDRNIDALIGLIAGSTRIPKRVLLGSENGELASTQDKTNWDRVIADRRESFAEVQIVRPFVLRMIEHAALPEPEQFDVAWPKKEDLALIERANLALILAQLNDKAGELVITGNEIRREALSLDPLDDSTMSDWQAQQQAINNPPQPAGGGTPTAQSPKPKGASSAPWRAIHHAADTHVEAIRKVVAAGLTKGKTALDVAELTRAYELGDRELADWVVMQALDVTDTYLEDHLPSAILSAVVTGANASLRQSKQRGSFHFTGARLKGAAKKPLAIGLKFDATNPEAASWAQAHAAELIAGLSEVSRAAIKVIITRMFTEGVSPAVAAREIQQVIGLTSGDEQAVEALRELLSNAAPGVLVKAGSVRIRVPATGVTEAFVEQKAAQYAARLLRQRGVTIARTESMAAANNGQLQLWRQARALGLLTGEEKKVWLATDDDRICPVCEAADGATAHLDQDFDVAGGLDGPPAHTRCRCALGLLAPGESA